MRKLDPVINPPGGDKAPQASCPPEAGALIWHIQGGLSYKGAMPHRIWYEYQIHPTIFLGYHSTKYKHTWRSSKKATPMI